MKKFSLFIFFIMALCLPSDYCQAQEKTSPPPPDYLHTSIQLLEALQAQQATQKYTDLLAASTLESIQSQLITDTQKLAFWINVYNAYIQIILRQHPEYYEDRRSFFKKPFIIIAGETLSFSQIEHGIIRKSMWELSLGYLRKLYAPKFERKLRVSKREARVHFALNCGAKSCPPIGIYRAELLDQQLEAMTKNYLQQQSSYDAANNRVHSTALFSWFRGDFGGFKGVKEMLHRLGLIPERKVDLKFTKYDWTLFLDNFIDIPLEED